MSDHGAPRIGFSIAASACAIAMAISTTAVAQPYDHLACYKIKDAKTFSNAGVALEALRAQFGPLDCRVRAKAKQACVPVAAAVTTMEGGAHSPFPSESPAFDRICYRVKCAGSAPSALEMGDAFGTRTLQGFKVATVCVPAVVGPAPTTTTTTLPPLPPCVGGGGFPACTGDCSGVGPSHVCDSRNALGTCACVLPCNDLDPAAGDLCGTGGCPVDSRCALVDPDHCGCVFDPGS